MSLAGICRAPASVIPINGNMQERLLSHLTALSLSLCVCVCVYVYVYLLKYVSVYLESGRNAEWFSFQSGGRLVLG